MRTKIQRFVLVKEFGDGDELAALFIRDDVVNEVWFGSNVILEELEVDGELLPGIEDSIGTGWFSCTLLEVEVESPNRCMASCSLRASNKGIVSLLLSPHF